MEDIKVYTADSEPLTMFDVIKSGNYSVATIKRIYDGKIFGCYYRDGSVQIGHSKYKSWFIENETDSDDEELCLNGIDETIYGVIEVIDEYF